MNRPEFFDIMSLVEDEHINILYERRAKVAENKLSAKRGKKLITLWFKRIALVLITTATVLAGILMLHEDVRAAVVNAFITWYDTYIQIDFSKIPEDTAQIDGTTDTVPADKEPEADTETQEPVENIYDLAVGYIPSGFKSVYTIEDNYTREYSYDDEDGNSLLIGIYDSKGTEVGVSNDDNYEYEKLLINNRETYVAYNEQEGIGSVSFGNDVYCVLISGASITDVLDKETLIKIAENIRKKDDTEDKEQTQEVKDIYKFEIGYIPDGFELMQVGEDDSSRNHIYYNEIGEYLVVGIYYSGMTEVNMDNEVTEHEQVSINGYNGIFAYNEAEKTGYLTYGNTEYTFTISSILEKEEFIKIAENIKEKDSNGKEEQDQGIKGIQDFEITYVPPGFTLTDIQERESLREYFYLKENGDFLLVGFYSSKKLSILLDIELLEYEQISINGNNYILSYNEIERNGYLTYGNTEYAIVISFMSEKEEIIKVAEGIK